MAGQYHCTAIISSKSGFQIEADDQTFVPESDWISWQLLSGLPGQSAHVQTTTAPAMLRDI